MPLYVSKAANMSEEEIQKANKEERPLKFDFLDKFLPFKACDISDALFAIDSTDTFRGFLDGIVAQNCGKLFTGVQASEKAYRIPPVLGYASTIQLGLLTSPIEKDRTIKEIKTKPGVDEPELDQSIEPYDAYSVGWAEDVSPSTPFTHWRTVVVVAQPEGQRTSAVEYFQAARIQSFNVKGLIVSGPVRDVAKLADVAMPIYASGSTIMGNRLGCKVESTQQPVMVKGVRVEKGDIIFMDLQDSVVVCIPQGKAKQVLEWLKTNMPEDAKQRVIANFPPKFIPVPRAMPQVIPAKRVAPTTKETAKRVKVKTETDDDEGSELSDFEQGLQGLVSNVCAARRTLTVKTAPKRKKNADPETDAEAEADEEAEANADVKAPRARASKKTATTKVPRAPRKTVAKKAKEASTLGETAVDTEDAPKKAPRQAPRKPRMPQAKRAAQIALAETSEEEEANEPPRKVTRRKSAPRKASPASSVASGLSIRSLRAYQESLKIPQKPSNFPAMAGKPTHDDPFGIDDGISSPAMAGAHSDDDLYEVSDEGKALIKAKEEKAELEARAKALAMVEKKVAATDDADVEVIPEGLPTKKRTTRATRIPTINTSKPKASSGRAARGGGARKSSGEQASRRSTRTSKAKKPTDDDADFDIEALEDDE